MLFETEGIVLKRRKINHNDVFITLFSRNLGKIQVFVKGGSNPRSSLNKGVHPFVSGRFMLRGEKTYSLSSVEVADSYYHFREDLKKLSYGSYMLDFADRVLEENEGNKGLHTLLGDALKALASKEGVEEKLRLYFEMKALGLLGYQPQVERCVVCGAEQPRYHAFDVPDGGVVCDPCHSRDGKGMRTHSTILLLMAYVQNTDLEHFLGKEIDGLLISKLDILINSYMEYHLGLANLKSKRFLEIFR